MRVGPFEIRRQQPAVVMRESKPTTIRIQNMQFEMPDITFPLMYEWALKDGTVKDVSDYVADQVMANGIQTDYNVEYDEGVKNGEGKGAQAKEAVDALFEDVGMDDLGWNTTKWGYLVGSVFWFDKTDFMRARELEIIPVDSIYQIKRTTTSEGYTRIESLIQGFEYGGKPIEGARLIPFRVGIDNTSGFGKGIMQTLLSTRTMTLRDPADKTTETIVVPPLIYVMALLVHDVQQGYHSYAMPKRLIAIKDLPPDKLAEFKTMWKKPGDVAVNYESNIGNATVSSGVHWATELGFIENRFIEVFGMPMQKLMTTPGFTEASATVARLIADRRVYSFQRWLKRGIEKNVINPFLEYKEFSPRKAQVRVNFGLLDKPAFTIRDVLTAVGLLATNPFAQPVMTAQEARALLRKIGWPDVNTVNDLLFKPLSPTEVAQQKTDQGASAPPPKETDKRVTDEETGRTFRIQETKK